MDRKEIRLAMEGDDFKGKQAMRTDRKLNQSKYSEVGNMAMAKNKNQNQQLLKSLDCYDKQRIKAARSIEFAQRSFKENLKTLSTKLGDGQFDDSRLRRFQGEKRRQSSPAQLSFIKSTDSLSLKESLSPESETAEAPFSNGTRSRVVNDANRLAFHRHSLPPDEYSSLRAFQSRKANKPLSLKPDTVNIPSNLKSASWSNLQRLQQTLSQAQQNLGNSKSMSSSLPKIDSVELTTERKTTKKVTFSENKVLPSIKKPENPIKKGYQCNNVLVETFSEAERAESLRGKKERNPVIDEESEAPIIIVSDNH